jgi:hypothetical protein
MQLKKVKHIFIFFLLFDAISLIISTVLKQKLVYFKVFASKNKLNQKYIAKNAGYYTIKRNESISIAKTQLQLITINAVPASTTATNYINYSKYDLHQPKSAYKLLPKLMLFPFHSFW